MPSPNKMSIPTENPIGDTFNIVVSVPESVEIRMVNASVLGDYEIWIFIASLLSNAVVGFLVAFIQALDSKSLNTSNIGWSLVVFVILFLIALAMAVFKRVSLRSKGRDIKLRTSSVVVSPNS